jgi:pimeloyl-ACP methyl ester carboxylesterase
MYDYGSPSENKVHYNQTTPPLYDLTKIKVPVALYWGGKDWLADPTDVQFIRKNLPNIVDDYDIQDYDHLDFIWSINANEVFYKRMIHLMNSYI